MVSFRGQVSKSIWDEVKHLISIDMAGRLLFRKVKSSCCPKTQAAKWGEVWIRDLQLDWLDLLVDLLLPERQDNLETLRQIMNSQVNLERFDELKSRIGLDARCYQILTML